MLVDTAEMEGVPAPEMEMGTETGVLQREGPGDAYLRFDVPPLREAGGKCVGGDAFAKVSISRWEPPANAPFALIQKWQKAKGTSDAAIKGFPRGGKDLRSFVHDQTSTLRLLRHDTFCGLL